MRRWIVGLTVLAFAIPGVAAPQVPPSPPVPPPLPPPLTPNDRYVPEPQRPAAQQFKELIPALIEALKDVDLEVRQNSAMALSSIGREAIPALKESLKDANKEKRAAAAYALGQMGYPAREAMPDLLKVLKDEENNVRRSASQAISRIVAAENNVYSFGMHPAMGTIGPIGAPLNPQLPPALPVPSPNVVPLDKR